MQVLIDTCGVCRVNTVAGWVAVKCIAGAFIVLAFVSAVEAPGDKALVTQQLFHEAHVVDAQVGIFHILQLKPGIPRNFGGHGVKICFVQPVAL